MANMNFGVNILPKTNNIYSLGNSDYKWNIFANQINGTDVSNFLTSQAAPQTDGNALVSVNGEWVPQSGYGYTKLDVVLPETSITIPPNQYFYVHVINDIGASVNADPIYVYYDGVEYVLERHETQSGSVTLYVYGNSTFSPSDAKFVINAIQQAGAPIQIGFNQSESDATHTIQIQQYVLTHIDNKYIDVPVRYGTGTVSTVEGASNTASGYGSHVEGVSNTASGSYTHAEGYYTTAEGFAAHAEGYHNVARGDYSHSEGYGNYATGTGSHAEGYSSYAMGDYSHAEGYSTARGNRSHAEGSTVANGAYSHTIGHNNIPDTYSNWDEWTANTSYAVGDKVTRTITSGDTTTVNGYICKIANSDSTFTAGNWTDCSGRMNYIEIVGNAMTYNTYSNARTLDWDGNGWYAGKVSVGTSANPPVPTADNDLTTKQYVDAHGLPSVTSSDNGKIPRVVNGAWALTTIASANGVSF